MTLLTRTQRYEELFRNDGGQKIGERHLKCLKVKTNKKANPEFYVQKISFKNEDKIKIFSDK